MNDWSLKNFFFKCLLFEITSIFLSHIAYSQSTPNTNLPSIMILPWQTPVIDMDLLRKTTKPRAEITKIIKNKLAPNAISLETLAPNLQSMITARPILKSTLAEPNQESETPIAVFPLWTRLHDYELFAVIVIDSAQNTIKKIVHKLVPKIAIPDLPRTESDSHFFEPIFVDLLTQLDLTTLPKRTGDLSIAIRDQTASLRANEMDRTTLILLLMDSWQADFTIQNPFHVELLTSIHECFGQSNTMRKANRDIITRISYENVPKSIKLPVTLTMNIKATDSVFGQTLPWSWSEPLKIGVKADNTILISATNRLRTELESEASSLKRDELPQIVKIKGAWAYVDKGRAWGLQMNDRLVNQENPNAIKGHVVSYFGPEQKLKSARGWPVNEGAIIYIRKGQRDIKIGQTFIYDKMTVPTPWPPQSSAAK